MTRRTNLKKRKAANSNNNFFPMTECSTKNNALNHTNHIQKSSTAPAIIEDCDNNDNDSSMSNATAINRVSSSSCSSASIPASTTQAAHHDATTEDNSTWNETCGICNKDSKNPRSTSCHHIFCKSCIRSSAVRSNGKTACPICKEGVTSKLQKYDPTHESYKVIEALFTKSAEVAFIFNTASAASLKMNINPCRIIEACQSLRRDDRYYKGYYWRFRGCKHRILRAGEGIKEGIPVEQICLQTGTIIQVFASGRKASDTTGISRCVIRRVLEKRGKANGGGFFWRYQGETYEPWVDPTPTNVHPVEKLDYETGDLLESFDSLADAKRAIGMKPNCGHIRDVCEGYRRKKSRGFFWRWRGSSNLPNHMRGVEKMIQIRKQKNGQLFKEFYTSKDAQEFIDNLRRTNVRCSSICRWCRGDKYELGFYWKYQMVKPPVNSSEALVGKRLRVLKKGNEWIEGKLKSFDAQTLEYEIEYDYGKIENHKLDDIDYELKNDNGQKPVEQIDLKSGKLITLFGSITEAALAMSCEPKYIAAVCLGYNRSSMGHFWRYKGSSAQPRKLKSRKRIQQLCLETGRVLATFTSITAAAKALGISTPGISYCCNGRNNSKSAGGFGWQFNDE